MKSCLIRNYILVLLGLLSSCGQTPSTVAANDEVKISPITLAQLEENGVYSGFRATSLYLDDRDMPMGARFVHLHTGFELALLNINTAPQAYIWVNTIPKSNMGLPHTQEHLLLGKGNKGRAVGGLENMSLIGFSAFTRPLHTAYHLNAVAGVDVFYNVLESKFDAMLHPDYTDEEIRREVHHFGVKGQTGSLTLEEKGTIYNEMKGSSNRPSYLDYYTKQAMLYGVTHPLALSAGGTPDAIRKIEPKHIRAFHASHYQLGNMGLIAVLSNNTGLAEVLTRTDDMLLRLQPEASKKKFDLTLPKPMSAPHGSVARSYYPSSNKNDQVAVSYVWPPHLKLSNEEVVFLRLFLQNIAGDPSTNLYKRLINSESRVINTKISSIHSYVSSRRGHSIELELSGITAEGFSEELLSDVKQLLVDELQRISKWQDQSVELAEFNTRFLTRVVAMERRARDNINAPPAFGVRSTGSKWYDFLQQINGHKSFRKSLTSKPEIAFVRAQLNKPGNIWKKWLQKWQLLSIEPYTVSIQPKFELLTEEKTAKQLRIQQEAHRLMEHYHVTEQQAALVAYQKDYDLATQKLDVLQELTLPDFLTTPPMTFDDFIDYEAKSVPGTSIPWVISTFENMTGGFVGLALSLQSVKEEQLVLLSVLSPLLTEVGIIDDGQVLSAEQVIQQQKNEISQVLVEISNNINASRIELTLVGSGTTVGETQLAIDWMKKQLMQANWSKENLPRIRDVIDQRLSALRVSTKQTEEIWVKNPYHAFRLQTNPLYLSVASFLTQQHQALRMRWMLRESSSDAVAKLFRTVAGAGKLPRKDLRSLLNAMKGEGLTPTFKRYLPGFTAMSSAEKVLVAEAARDLQAELEFLPNDSLSSDWTYLFERIAADLQMAPTQVLSNLTKLRNDLLLQEGARVWAGGSSTTLKSLVPNVTELLEPLRAQSLETANTLSRRGTIWSRLDDRGVDTSQRVFAAYIHQNLKGAAVTTSAPLFSYDDTETDQLLDFLALSIYSGTGGHSLHMRTWAAGLAFGNGIWGQLDRGRIRYFATRSPSLPQTLSFVAKELNRHTADPALPKYAMAQLFSSRAAKSYEFRTAAIAADLADGLEPAKIKRFREAILALREHEDLHILLDDRIESVTGKIIPGYGQKLSTVEGGIYFVLGNEESLAEYETWLREVEAEDTVLHRLYPRDFWLIAK